MRLLEWIYKYLNPLNNILKCIFKIFTLHDVIKLEITLLLLNFKSFDENILSTYIY